MMDSKQLKISFPDAESRIRRPTVEDGDQALLLFMATSGVPFSVVENDYFLEFLRVVRSNPEYKVPCRAMLAGPRLNALHLSFTNYLRNLFSHCLSLTATTYGMKKNKQSYWSLTLSGVDPRTWSLVSAAVACEPTHPVDYIEGKLSGKAMARVLLPIFDRLELDKTKLDNIVTDNGSVATVVARFLSDDLEKPVGKVLCASHRLQTVLRNAVKEYLDAHPSEPSSPPSNRSFAG